MFFASQRPHENLPRNTMHTVTSYRATDNNQLSGNARLQFAQARPRISFLKRKTVWLSVLLVSTPSGLLSYVQTDATKHCWPSSVGSWCVHLHDAKRLTLRNNSQQHTTTCNRMCKRTQHVTSNNVGSCWLTKGRPFTPGFTVCSERLNNYEKKLHKKKTSTLEKEDAFWAWCPFWRDLIQCTLVVRTEKLVCKAACKRTQHC